MRQFFALIAFVCFCISFIIHFATYIGINALEHFPIFLILHLISIAFLFIVAKKLRGQRTWDIILNPIPSIARKVLISLTIYVGVNFLFIVVNNIGKSVPQRINGDFALYRIEDDRQIFVSPDEVDSTNYEIIDLNGQPVLRTADTSFSIFRELTETEYYRQTLQNTRLFTGHWMLFLLLPTFYFWYKESPSKN